MSRIPATRRQHDGAAISTSRRTFTVGALATAMTFGLSLRGPITRVLPGMGPNVVSAQNSLDSKAMTTADVHLRSGAGKSYSSLLVIPAGSIITVHGGYVSNGYITATYGDTDGYVHTDYLQVVSANPDVDGPIGVAQTTDRVNLRASATVQSISYGVIPAWTDVTIFGVDENGFEYVGWGGMKGWVSQDYLHYDGRPAPGTPSSPTGETRVVLETLNLRKGAGTSYDVVSTMPAGTVVTVMGEVSNGFLPVKMANGITGWAYAQYLGGEASTPPPAGDTSIRGWTTSTVFFRTGPGTNYDIKWELAADTELIITGTAVNGFYPVKIGSSTGYVSVSWITTGQPDAGEGDVARTNDRMNLRSGPSTSNSVKLVIPNGAKVTVTGAAVGGFYPVTYDGVSGWVYALGLNF